MADTFNNPFKPSPVAGPSKDDLQPQLTRLDRTKSAVLLTLPVVAMVFACLVVTAHVKFIGAISVDILILLCFGVCGVTAICLNILYKNMSPCCLVRCSVLWRALSSTPFRGLLGVGFGECWTIYRILSISSRVSFSLAL